jgi:hypothetical protein
MQAQPDSLRPTQLSFERGQRAMIKVVVLGGLWERKKVACGSLREQSALRRASFLSE